MDRMKIIKYNVYRPFRDLDVTVIIKMFSFFHSYLFL